MPSASSPGITRSNSPSGFTQFLTKPSKWFTRSASTSKLPNNNVIAEPRPSGSSTRKHKISRPTDPRPILDGYVASNSRSVMNLSARPPGSLDIPPPHPTSTPSSPVVPSYNQNGLGDLRNISRKGWSRSADDLSKISPLSFSPIKTSFQDKVAEYRNRSDSNASAMTSSSPTSPLNPASGRHPFPTIRNASPASTSSSSPPRSATLPAVSISSPVADEGPLPKSATHVHTRSHSFTPKLSSKLSAPVLFGSFKQEVPGASEQDLGTKDREVSPNRPNRSSTSPWGITPIKATSDTSTPSTPQTHRATTLLAPPSITGPNPEELDDTDSKRSSQILYHSGFINRLVDVPNHFHHTNLALAKGWKPFKLELKGSKMYFYKPPGDRTAAVKDLFPTEFVPASLEDEDEAGDADAQPGDDESDRAGKGREDLGTSGRKKRAFWGRRTHPDIVQGGGKIEKGTFEALVHEAVFATTFLPTRDHDQEDSETAADQRREQWKDFASSVILCLPSIVGQAKFEVEFLRCCEYLVSGADDDLKVEERSRVGWLASEYRRYHGMPVDQAAWDEWRQQTIPDISVAQSSPASVIPMSSSMQAMHPSPILMVSPNINTFSPRPNEDAKMASLLGALSVQDVPPSPSKKASLELRNFEHQQSLRSGARMPWAALEQEGLSRDVLLLLDPSLIAHSLILFHRSVLEKTPENLTASFVMGSESSAQDTWSFGLLFGSADQPHWLTKLLLIQILGADTSTGTFQPPPPLASPGRKSEDRNASTPQQTSRTHSRSEVISVWTRVGELCRLAGDECSWRAIFAALCSRPVARLDKAWKRVDLLALAAIESWVYPGSDGETVGVKEPKVTPWGGDIRERLKDELGKASGEVGELSMHVESFETARALFEGFRTSFSLCPRRVPVEGQEGEDVQRMVTYWQDMAAESGGPGSLATKFQRIEQFMSLSLAAEPRRKGLFEPYFWSRSPSIQLHPTSLLPLLFPEPLPAVSLIDRNQILRGRVESDVSDVHNLRGLDALQPEKRRPTERPNPDIQSGLASLSQGGTVIPVYSGDLLLVVQSGGIDSNPDSRPSSSRGPSRPSSSVVDHGMEKGMSRNPSMRVKPGSSHGLDRKPSVARRNSLPSLSQRQNFVMSEPSSEPPLRVVVQAGTLNMLVNILVHGLHNVSVSVADDNGEMSLRERPTRELFVDRAEFARVWWNVFRSFVSPLVFFELLRKLYITLQPIGSSPSIAEYLYVANARSEVLETIKEWLTLGGGAQDVLDDPQLFSGIRSFLDNHSDHVVYEASNFEDANVHQAWASLVEMRHSLCSSFVSQTMRPLTTRGPPIQRGSMNGSGARSRNLSTREPPDVDRIEPEDFVDNLDSMACAAFSNVTEEDLYITADLLEVQSADRTGWFLPRDTTVDDGVEVQTMYSHVQEVDHSSLISELNQDSLYRVLPPGVRSCVRAYSILRKWIISKIVARRLGLRARQARLELLLRVLEVSRLRNMNSTPTSRLVDKPCVRSFVEAVTTSAILSVESRMHHRAWQNVAVTRRTNSDSLASILSKPYMQSASSHVPLTPDMGWMMERILEVIASPDVIESSTPESQSLVNFNKRRQLHDLIEKGPALPATRRRFQPDDLNRRAFERLNNIEKDVNLLQFDHRGIRDEAIREGLQHPGGTPSSSKKATRPFQRLVIAQQDKNRRDKYLRARLQKEKLQEQLKHDRRDEQLNRAMRPRKQGPAALKQHRNKKSMSAFLHFMRPISSAFGSDTALSSTGIKKTPAELDFTPVGKPSLVLSLLDAHVAQFINNERSFTFQLDTEDGGHYLLQAMNRRDMMKWMETINRVTKMAAKRRLTYLGNSPKARVSDHIHDPIVASRDPMAVFGVELEFLLQREVGGQAIRPSAIPSIIELCLAEVEARGLSEQGIYRIAGAASEINALKDAFNRGENPISSSTDIYAVCDLVKTWFRVLPEPVFPSSSYHDVIKAMQLEDLDTRLSILRNVVQGLPQANFDLLKRVSEHLDKVTDFEEHNHMTAEALAIVFSPNLLRAPKNDFVMILANMGHTHKLVKALITHFHVIFDDADPEAEVHSEDDLDSPILEEVEEEEEDSLGVPQGPIRILQ